MKIAIQVSAIGAAIATVALFAFAPPAHAAIDCTAIDCQSMAVKLATSMTKMESAIDMLKIKPELVLQLPSGMREICEEAAGKAALVGAALESDELTAQAFRLAIACPVLP